ncbi:MAG TPA: polyribonucleotide nucleotidyltransferase [bacterium]|nr:polyribonucleotide nucleotidyltransferase [bacterium]
MITKSIELAGRTLSIETGRMAKQADGAVLVRYGDTVILATAVASAKPVENRGFFPLTIEYREKAYAAGKIPGGFFKREGRPGDKEVLSARLIDRPIRPLFPENFRHEVQVAVTVLSSDKENDADVLGTIGSSAALCISRIPFKTPIASVRVGRIGGEFVINPTFSQLEESDINVIIAASEDAIAMVEGEAGEISEEELIRALDAGHAAIREIIALENALIVECNPVKMPVEPVETDEELIRKVRQTARERLPKALGIRVKQERYAAVDAILAEIQESLAEAYPEQERVIQEAFHDEQKDLVRRMILDEERRIDGRGYDDIRPITCEVSVLPRTHGSALFTRGETQSLTVTTLGTRADEQKIENLDGSSWKSYMLHYNFPPFCVGEVKPFRGPGRREIGHGNLAERALKPVIPNDVSFPYTIRIVSDVLESNGSSSMATVCAGSLSLMDAGVPVKSAVAGIAMGLVMEGKKVAILTDILGDEDHLGDMDFKLTGTRKGITAFQMDIKITGISSEIMRTALDKAQKARLSILDAMDQALSKPREEISRYAPRIISIRIDVDDIGMVIGPGGKMIREIIERTGAEINIEDDGTVQIASDDVTACEQARAIIQGLVQKPEEGKIYQGKVKKITNFGAFVEILPGKEGLLHISEIELQRINRVEDHLKLGDIVEVKLQKISPDGKYDLSRKAVLKEKQNQDST